MQLPHYVDAKDMQFTNTCGEGDDDREAGRNQPAHRKHAVVRGSGSAGAKQGPDAEGSSLPYDPEGRGDGQITQQIAQALPAATSETEEIAALPVHAGPYVIKSAPAKSERGEERGNHIALRLRRGAGVGGCVALQRVADGDDSGKDAHEPQRVQITRHRRGTRISRIRRFLFFRQAYR